MPNEELFGLLGEKAFFTFSLKGLADQTKNLEKTD